MKEYRWLAERRGARLDVWLRGALPDYSRARLQGLIKEGRVQVDGRPVKAAHRLAVGERISVSIPDAAPAVLRPQSIPLDVLYEDADIVVVNKPAGLVVHPAAGHADGTLANALLHRCRDLTGIGGELRPGIAHRLDKDTSGVLVAAKTETALNGLVAQFKARTVHKDYLALVWGVPRPASGAIETPIGRSRHDRKKMSAAPARGRPALTRYATVETFGALAALLRVTIATGRTHQIRVHLTHLGHSVVGDRQYGRRRPEPLPVEPARQMLHAARLAFAHPRTGAPLAFEAPLPADMQSLLAALRRQPAAH
jgi:23S rRNA pseudouridine1911/1915/1917 synthase